MKKAIYFLAVFVILFGVFCSCNHTDNSVDVNINMPGNENNSSDDESLTKYNEAMALLEQGKLEEAYTIFLTLKDYKDVMEHLSCLSFKYKQIVDAGRPDTYYEYDEYGKITYEYHTSPSVAYSYTYEYDENQRLIKAQYDSDLGKQSIKLYEYDAVGNLIKQTDINGDTVYVTSFAYDVRGNKIRVVSEKFNIIIEYKYDDANNLLETIVKNKDGEVTESSFSEYDSNNRLIRQTIKYGSGTQVTTYEYDESGNTLFVVNEIDGEIISRQEYEYDENGKCKKQLNTYASGVGSVVLWSYDETGTVIEERKEENGQCLSSTRYEYDENGDCVKKTYTLPTLNRSSEVISEYDKWGNLLRVEYVDREGEKITKSQVVEYRGYTLYYDPFSTQDFPLYDGK